MINYNYLLFIKIIKQIIFFFKNKSFHVRYTMQLNISARLTPQVTTIIYHHMKKLLLNKRKKKENTKIRGTRPKLIC